MRETAGEPADQGYGAQVFSHGSADEGERLSLIEEEQDPYTIARIQSLGIAEDWSCLEIGAGRGSIARWLSDRCPRGRVVATDLDVSLLSSEGRANLEIRRHDVATDDFSPGSFNLIHARGILTHVRERDVVCRRMVS